MSLTIAAFLPLAICSAASPSDEAVALEKTAMTTLAAWGGSNLLAGSAGWLFSDDPKNQAFHAMNAGWGAVNLGLAVAGNATNRKQTSEHKRKERWLRLPSIFAFNAGLDVAYISAGAWLWHTGVDGNDPTREGWGQSLVIQGSALMIFDLVMAHRFNESNREIWLSTSSTGPSIAGIF